MKIIFTIAILTAAVFQTGCASTAAVTSIAGGSIHRASMSTDAEPVEVSTANTIAIKHSRYQFFPDAAVIDKECREKLADEVQRTRPGVKFDDKAVAIKHSRNVLFGTSSCTASVVLGSAE